MATPFIGEIKIFAGNFAPSGWAICDGRLMPIADNPALFSLLGTTYGGDGQTTFGLPDLRGRVPIHQGQGNGLSNRILGLSGGQESVTVSTQQLPAHTHAANASAGGGSNVSPTHNYWATDPGGNTAAYSSGIDNTSLQASAISSAGGGAAHNNMSPFTVLTFIISMFGIFPSRN